MSNDRFSIEMNVVLDLTLDDEATGRVGRCLGIFEDFCIVKESVRQGIPVSVEVTGVPELAA